MKLWMIACCLIATVGCNNAAQSTTIRQAVGGAQPIAEQLVEASCGECQFNMAGNGCDLAIRIDGKAYFVDGTSLDEHGDAHSPSGMCNCVRQARVSGEISNDRFLATSFELLPEAELPPDNAL